WDEERPAALAGHRHTRQRPAARHDAEHVGHDCLNAPALLGIDVAEHRGAVLAVVPLDRGVLRVDAVVDIAVVAEVHDATVSTVDSNPLRTSEKLCLYSPRLILCVTLLT